MQDLDVGPAMRTVPASSRPKPITRGGGFPNAGREAGAARRGARRRGWDRRARRRGGRGRRHDEPAGESAGDRGVGGHEATFGMESAAAAIRRSAQLAVERGRTMLSRGCIGRGASTSLPTIRTEHGCPCGGDLRHWRRGRARGRRPRPRGVTRREAEVLDAVAERLTNAEVAARLHVSERTVESHVSSLLRKLGARNRIDLRVARCVTPRARAPSVPATAGGRRPSWRVRGSRRGVAAADGVLGAIGTRNRGRRRPW